MSTFIDLTQSEVPRRIRELRRGMLVSQAELAARAGVSSRTITDIETGRRPRVQEGTLLMICGALEVSLRHVLRPAGRGTSGARPRRFRAARSRMVSRRRVVRGS